MRLASEMSWSCMTTMASMCAFSPIFEISRIARMMRRIFLTWVL
jgi:hypothetical protein